MSRSAALKRAWKVRRNGETRREYLIRKSKRIGGCWIWQGHTATTGYGQAEYKWQSISAHRMSYLEFNGKIPKGILVRHTCDNAACIKPSHLVLGTKKDNRRDFMERHPKAKELCSIASKIGAKGLKEFWKRMTIEERASFCERRAIIQAMKRKIKC